jgi:hypothetical protein
MEIYLTLILIILATLSLLFIARRVLSARHRPPPQQAVDDPIPQQAVYDPIPPAQVEHAFTQLQATLAQQTGPIKVMPHHGYPDAIQWLLLLQRAPEDAEELGWALRKQMHMYGLSAEVVIIESIIAYEAAQQYLRTFGPAQQLEEQAPASLGGGQGYPGEQEWRQRLAEDRKEAMRLLHQLELQRARFGISAPPTLEASIAAFHRAEQGMRSDADKG